MSARDGSFLSKLVSFSVIAPAVIVVTALVACGGGATGGVGGAGGGGTSTSSGTGTGGSGSYASSSSGSTSSGGMGDAVNGKKLVSDNACAGCHQTGTTDILAGQTTPVSSSTSTFGSNLTPDMDTGLGKWSAQQIKDAISMGARNDGTKLCMQMIPFHNFSAPELDDVVAYLQSIPPVSNAIPKSTCH